MALSKSRFISGIQCPKKLYFDTKRKDLKPVLSKNQELLFSKGHDIGFWARNLFPNGWDASPEHYYNFSPSIQKTKEWIRKGITTIYEAAFENDDVLAALDILHQHNGSSWAIEVKSSTSVKAYHIDDAALQYWVMKKSGHEPDRFFIMHINSQFIRNGKIDYAQFFKLTDITAEVQQKQLFISESIDRLKKVLKSTQEPSITIGRHCQTPFQCDYQYHCKKELPKPSILDLPIHSDEKWKLWEAGKMSTKDLDPAEIEITIKKAVLSAFENQSAHFDVHEVRSFLNALNQPVHYLDISNLFTAIPPLNHCKPYQMIPFQFSFLSEGSDSFTYQSDPTSFCVLNEIGETAHHDPRLTLLNELEKILPLEGSILISQFEMIQKLIRELQINFPEKSSFLIALNNRLQSIQQPFLNGTIYYPGIEMNPSLASILQYIQPASNALQITSESQASACYESLIYGSGKNEFLTNLTKYSVKNVQDIQAFIHFLRSKVASA